MDWQLLIVALLVMAALGYLGRSIWRSLRPGPSGCSGGCGCHSVNNSHGADRQPSTLIPPDQLLGRLRKGPRS